jgi:ferritin-like metal-binding protein YciE
VAPERKRNACLKPREYRDQKGDVHHHRRCYIGQHGERSGNAGDALSNGHGSQLRHEDGNPARSDDGRLGDLFLAALKNIYSAETQMLRAMWSIGRKIQSDQLHQALERHGEETETQVERLEQVFEMLNKPAGGKACKAIEQTVSEVYQVIEKFKDSDALDAPLISAVRAVENYEISCYEKLKTWAEELGMEDAVKLLDETLQEEKKTGAILWKIAEEEVNKRAA